MQRMNMLGVTPVMNTGSVCRFSRFAALGPLGLGLLAAIVWVDVPLALPHVLLPFLTLRQSFRAVEQAKERAAAFRLRTTQLETAIQAGQRLSLPQPRVTLLHPLVVATSSRCGCSGSSSGRDVRPCGRWYRPRRPPRGRGHSAQRLSAAVWTYRVLPTLTEPAEGPCTLPGLVS